MRKWKILIEQEDNIIEVDSDDYLYLLKILGYDSEILAETPPYEGNKIIIRGNLDLSNTPTTSLHNVVKIIGKLDIRYSKISDISNIKIPEHWVSDYGSTLYLNRQRKIKEEKLSAAQERRENNEWDLDNPDIDDEGIRANVVLSYFIKKFPEVKVKTSDDSKKLIELTNRIEQLLQLEKQYEKEGRDLTDIYADIEVTEEQINEINNSIDVYNFIPLREHYELSAFEFVYEDELDGYKFAVGTTEEATSSLREYYQEYVDSPRDFFTRERLEDYIDASLVGEVAREFYDSDVRDSLSSYFDDEDYELSEDEQERLDQLTNELDEYNEKLEMYPDDTPEYEQIVNHIEDLENEIEELEDSKEISETQIEDKIDELVQEVEDNPISFVRQLDLDIANYIDTDAILDDLVRNSDYGSLNGWDSTYDEIKVLGEYYVVMNYDR